MGLALSPELAGKIAESLATHAAATGNFLRIDMEDSPVTQVTLDIVRRCMRGRICAEPLES